MAPGSSVDRLSNLPDGVLETIFSNLSAREAVRTSVLSTKWRYKWISFPDLIFNDECIPGSVGSVGHHKLVKIINHVLLVHRSPIRKFKLCSSHLGTCSEIDSWVFSLLFHPLIQLELQVSQGSLHRHSLPRCVFSMKCLNHLILAGCVISKPPLSFKSFPFLTTLFLQSVTVSDAALKCLLSSCPELESLTLKLINGDRTHIELSNPKLKYISIDSSFVNLCLKDLKLLVYLVFDNCLKTDILSFSNFFGSLLSIEELYLGALFFKSFAYIDVPKRLPITYHRLKSISLCFDPNSGCEILVALCLLNCSPNLHKLKIEFWSSSDSSLHLQETEDQLKNMTFSTLRFINFSIFCGLKIQLLLIKLLLAKSPVLETMVIHSIPMDSNKESTIWKELLQFKRASPQAEVVPVITTYRPLFSH